MKGAWLLPNPHPWLRAPHTPTAAQHAQHLPWGVRGWGLSPVLAPHTCDSRNPSQEWPPGARCFSAQGFMIRRGWRGRLRLVGWGNILGVPQADPISPAEPHAMALLWVVLGFYLSGSSFGKCKAQAGLAAARSSLAHPLAPAPKSREQEAPCPASAPPAAPLSLLGSLWAPHSSTAWRSSASCLIWPPPFTWKPGGALGSSTLQICP